MTQSLCGNCGTGLSYGSPRCPRCGLMAAPPQAAMEPSYPVSPHPGPSPYGQAYAPGAVPPPATYGVAPYGYPGGQAAPSPGWGVLEAFLTGDWAGAAKSAVFAVLAMLGASLVGMLLVAGGELGFHETFVLVLGGACLAVGGDAFVDAQVSSYDFESPATSISIGVLPLTVTLAGLIVLGSSFARRLRRRGVTSGLDVSFQIVRTALVFTLFFLPLSLLTRFTPDPFEDEGLAELVRLDGRVGVGVGSSLFGALSFAVAATGLVALLRRSVPRLGRFRSRVFPALMGALTVFAAGAMAAFIFVVWGLTDIGGDDGAVQFLGASVLGFVNGMLAAVLWTAGVPVTGRGGLAGEVTDGSGVGGRSESVSLLTFTDASAWFWVAPVVLVVVMLAVAVVVVLRQHTVVDARLEGLRFAAALGLVAMAAALLLRIAVSTTASGGGFGSQATVSATFNPFLAAFVLALWGAVTGLLAPAIAATLPARLVQSVRRRFGMAPVPAPKPVPVPPATPPQNW